MSYDRCKWCRGRGCLYCEAELRKDVEQSMQPIFIADPNDPEDIQLLKGVFGREAIEHAYGPDGEGAQEIELKAILATVRQLARKQASRPAADGDGVRAYSDG